MQTFLRKNFAIVLAFLLPILLIAGVAVTLYVPSLFLSTDYNFLYALCKDDRNYYNYGTCDSYLRARFTVVDGKLKDTPVDPKLDLNKDGLPDFSDTYGARVFLHDTQKNESREISVQEAQLLNLNNLLTSPDGVTVSSRYSRGADVFPFGGGGSSFGYYLTKGNSRSKLNLIHTNDDYYYYNENNFEFLGWVLPGRN